MHALRHLGGTYIARKRLKQNVPIYRQIEELLDAEIASERLEPGARLPSERQICEIYGVSVTPVRRALQSLVSKGLVKRRRGSGSFVAESPAASRPITIVFHKWLQLASDPVYSELFSGIVDGAGARGNSVMIEQLRERVPTAAEIGALSERLRRARSRGVLFLGEPSEEILEGLSAVGRILQVGHHLEGDRFSYVGSDVPGAVNMAADALSAAGAGPIAFFDGRGPGTEAEGLAAVEKQKLDAYLAWCRANDGDVVRVSDAGELLRLGSQERARDRLLGVIAHESGTGVKMMNSALDVGMRPGRDFLLIAFDNGNRGERTNIRMSSVKTFSLRMGQRAVEVLATLASGNRTVTETLPAQLIRRETCGQPSHSAR